MGYFTQYKLFIADTIDFNYQVFIENDLKESFKFLCGDGYNYQMVSSRIRSKRI